MSISNNSLYSCYVRSDVNQFTYQYTIDGFAERNHLVKSSVFHAEDSSWSVLIAPVVKNVTDGQEYLGLFLNRESGDKVLWAEYTFSLIDHKTGGKMNAKSNSCLYNQNNIQTNNSRHNNSLAIHGNNCALYGTNGSGHRRQGSANHLSAGDLINASGDRSFTPGTNEMSGFEFSQLYPVISRAPKDQTRPPGANSKFSGIKSFITRDTILDPKNSLSDNNKIIVCCDISLFTICEPLETLESFDFNLSENYSSLLKDSSYADIKLIVEGVEIMAHKAILSTRSPVFNSMFRSNMLESTQNVIKIEDLSKEVVEELLSFIYSGKVKDLSKVAKELLSAADKYDVPQLRQLCEQHLMANLSVDTAPEVLVLSHLHKAFKLKSVAIEFIIANRKDVMKSQNWDLIRTKPDLLEELFKALSTQFDKFDVCVN